MDHARGIAIVLVVLHNIGSILDEIGVGASEGFAPIENFFAPFRMPLLMFLSGLLLSRSLSKPTARYFKGKLAGIGWPYLVWSLIFLVVAAQVSVGYLARIIYDPPTYLWYLWFLMAFYTGAWLLRKMGVSFALVLGVSLVLAFIAPDAYRLSRFFYLLVFFLAGDIAARNMNIVRSVVARPMVIGVAVVSTLAAGVLSVIGVAVRYEAPYIIGVFGAIVLVMHFLPNVPNRGPMTWLAYVGRHSLIYYVTHRSSMWIVVVVALEFTTSYWIIYPVAFVVGLGVATAFSFGASRSPAIQALFVWPLHVAVPASKKIEVANG